MAFALLALIQAAAVYFLHGQLDPALQPSTLDQVAYPIVLTILVTCALWGSLVAAQVHSGAIMLTYLTIRGLSFSYPELEESWLCIITFLFAQFAMAGYALNGREPLGLAWLLRTARMKA
jgi:hypothetical protein